MRYDLTASIVTYRNDPQVLTIAFQSFLDSGLNIRLYVIDNSLNRDVEQLCDDERVEYIYTGSNLGFGSAHNLVLKNQDKLGGYHLILNPDIAIPQGTLEVMFDYAKEHQEVGMMMPRVLNVDGSVQYLPKLFPHPMNLVLRFVSPLKNIFPKMDERYMLSGANYTQPLEVSIVSGCFMFVRRECLMEYVFDERFFMYFEDFDLSRRIGEKYKLMMLPQVQIYHDYERGAHKSFFLFKTLVSSMIKYFNKYSWCFDRYRNQKNKEILAQAL